MARKPITANFIKKNAAEKSYGLTESIKEIAESKGLKVLPTGEVTPCSIRELEDCDHRIAGLRAITLVIQHAMAHEINRAQGVNITQCSIVELLQEAGAILSEYKDKTQSGHRGIAAGVINTLAMLIAKQCDGSGHKEPLDTLKAETTRRINKQWSEEKSWALGSV